MMDVFSGLRANYSMFHNDVIYGSKVMMLSMRLLDPVTFHKNLVSFLVIVSSLHVYSNNVGLKNSMKDICKFNLRKFFIFQHRRKFTCRWRAQ